MGTLFSYIRPYLWYFLLTYVVVTVSSCALVAFVRELSVIIDSGLVHGVPEYGILASVLLMVLFMSISTFLRLWLSVKGAGYVIRDIRKRLYDKIVDLAPSVLENTSVSLLMTRLITDTTVLHTILNGSVPVICRNSTILIGSIAMLIHTNKILAAYSAIVLPVLLLVIALLGKSVKDASLSFRRSMDKLTHFGEETCRGIKVIQSFTVEDKVRSRFYGLLDNVATAAGRHVLRRATLVTLIIAAVTGSMAIVLWVGIQAVAANSISAGTLLSFVFYSMLAAGSISGIGDNLQDLRKAVEISEDITALLNTDCEKASEDGCEDISDVKESIEINNVHFSYPSKPEVPILKGISISIKKGEKVAIVGYSGGGKSTIIDLMLRFYAISGGSITVDGTDIRNISLQSLRFLFCLVPQNPMVFSGTILDNITYGVDSCSSEELNQAIAGANIADFINGLPDGLNTFVGEGGVCISEGQKQRIVIARAILRRPEVLILDEATSALDYDSEHKVQKVLQELMRGKIMIMMAHRLSTVVDADKIVVINNGVVHEVGTHDTLMKSENSLYAKLFRLQLQGVAI